MAGGARGRRPRIWALAGALAIVVLLFDLKAQAIFNEAMLTDPSAEARAQEIMQTLRCLVCQNQSISDSNAPLARDLRLLVRERIAAGDSDAEAVAFIVERYGDWVLLEPPFKATTYLLWIGPLLVLIVAGGAVVVYQRRMQGRLRAEVGPAPLSAEERRLIERLSGDDSGRPVC